MHWHLAVEYIFFSSHIWMNFYSDIIIWVWSVEIVFLIPPNLVIWFYFFILIFVICIFLCTLCCLNSQGSTDTIVVVSCHTCAGHIHIQHFTETLVNAMSYNFLNLLYLFVHAVLVLCSPCPCFNIHSLENQPVCLLLPVATVMFVRHGQYCTGKVLFYIKGIWVFYSHCFTLMKYLYLPRVEIFVISYSFNDYISIS